MATINFSVPDEIKREFQETFATENRSSIIAGLMRQAVAERQRQQRRATAIEELLALRSRMPVTTAAEIHRVRKADRP